MSTIKNILAETSRKPTSLTRAMDRRSQRRIPAKRASLTTLTSTAWELDFVPASERHFMDDVIRKLAKHSIEENIFFEPEVLNAAWPRLGKMLTSEGCWMICLYEGTDHKRQLRLFMPIRFQWIGFPRKLVMQPLANEYMPLGTPLVHKDNPAETMENFLRLLADPALDLPLVMDFTYQRKDGPVFNILQQAAKTLGLSQFETLAHERACLARSDDQTSSSQLGSKRMREYKRQLRRMGELGEVSFRHAKSVDDVLDAFEGFLTLELNSWKGRGGTSLYNQKRITSFSRQIVADLSARRACEIMSLHLANRPIAALIIIGYAGHYKTWKMAFDEKLAPFSPGVQVMLHATQTLAEQKSFVEADSLAKADHWMMNRLWKDRLRMADLTIGLTCDCAEYTAKVSQAKERLVNAKSTAKDVVSRVKNLKIKLR